jgi:amidohydrolase
MTTQLDALKRSACRAVDGLASELVALSHAVHGYAETAFHEHRSARTLMDFLRRHGMQVRSGVAGLPTAFAADAGTSGPLTVVLCEYDALPGMGHGCGHNVVAAAGAGAGAALAALTASGGGRVRVLGSPAEESGGGKVLLARAGALGDAAAAMLVHPNAYETAWPHLLAAATLEIGTHGRAAHATLFPERGINALDGLLLGYLALSALRPHLPAGARVSGVIANGGQAPNVVPDSATGRFIVRGRTSAELARVAHRMLAAVRGGAASVGATVSVRPLGPVYPPLKTDPALAAAFENNLRELGRNPLPEGALPAQVAGSTDLGYVSHLAPTIHPMLKITNWPVVPHTSEFAKAAVAPRADRVVVDGAKALAMTALDIWVGAANREESRHDHQWHVDPTGRSHRPGRPAGIRR